MSVSRASQKQADPPDLGTGVANCPLSIGRLSVLALNLSLALSLAQLHSIAREKAAQISPSVRCQVRINLAGRRMVASWKHDRYHDTRWCRVVRAWRD